MALGDQDIRGSSSLSEAGILTENMSERYRWDMSHDSVRPWRHWVLANSRVMRHDLMLGLTPREKIAGVIDSHSNYSEIIDTGP